VIVLIKDNRYDEAEKIIWKMKENADLLSSYYKNAEHNLLRICNKFDNIPVSPLFIQLILLSIYTHHLISIYSLSSTTMKKFSTSKAKTH